MGGEPRNPNEQKWRDAGLTTYNSNRFDKVYRNLARLRCNLRVKYEELRIIWGRQELNRYKSRYANLVAVNNSTLCSYCGQEDENEFHLYTKCTLQKHSWRMHNYGFARHLGLLLH